MDSHML